MKRYSTIALALGALALGACKDNPVANSSDAPTVDALGTLTRTSMLQLTIGALAQDRTTINDIQFAIEGGILGRDVYRVDASEPRYVTETLGGNPDPGSFAGGRGFGGFYTAIRAENTLLLALSTAPTTIFTPAEINAQRGFLRTIKAMEYWRLIETRDTVGVPIQTDDPSAVTDVRCKTPVLAYIAALLDSANADFTAAGPTTKLPVKLPTGFTAFGRDYSTVANLILFNRAWKGKVDFYRGLDLNRDGNIDKAEWDQIQAAIAKSENVGVAIKPGGQGDISKTHVAWRCTRGLPYVASPLFYDGRIYLIKNGGMLTSLDAKTGNPFYTQERLDAEGSYYSSPVAAGGRIYLASSPGKLTVIKAGGDKPEILHQAEFGERIFSTPALVGDNLYLRTQSTLYAFGSANSLKK